MEEGHPTGATALEGRGHFQAGGGGIWTFPGRRGRRDAAISREEGEEGHIHFQEGGEGGMWPFPGRRGKRDMAREEGRRDAPIFRQEGEEGHGHFQGGGGGGTHSFSGRRDAAIFRKEGEEGHGHFQGGGRGAMWPFSGRMGRRDVAISREEGEEGHTHFQGGRGGRVGPSCCLSSVLMCMQAGGAHPTSPSSCLPIGLPSVLVHWQHPARSPQQENPGEAMDGYEPLPPQAHSREEKRGR